MPFKFKLAARTVPLWNRKAGNSQASCRQGPSATVKRMGSICRPAFGDSGGFCWAVPTASYFMRSYRILKSKGSSGNSERIWPWKKFSMLPRREIWLVDSQTKESQTFIYHCILSTLLTFFKKPSKLTLFSDHHPNSLYSASGHSKEKIEHWKLRKQIWNCHSITTVLAVSISACCNS